MAEAEFLTLETLILAAAAVEATEMEVVVDQAVVALEMVLVEVDVNHKVMQLNMAEAAELEDLKVTIQTTVAMAIKV